MEHEFKTDPTPFKAIWEGTKKAELRDLSDRPTVFVGDRLSLREYDCTRGEAWYTGARITATVTHIQKGYGLPPEYAMLSLRVLKRYGSMGRTKT